MINRLTFLHLCHYDEVSPDFWREFATECRAERPDCVLLGELIHGDYHRHVAPDLLDSGTNYQLSKALFSRQGRCWCPDAATGARAKL